MAGNEENGRSSSEGSSSSSENGEGLSANRRRRAQVQSEGALAEDENSPTSTSSADSRDGLAARDVNAGGEIVKARKKKPKAESSVVHDREKGISTCKHCGWIYSNPRPSAKLRREHRKHCGKFQSVNAWMDSDAQEEEKGRDVETTVEQEEQQGQHNSIKDETVENNVEKSQNGEEEFKESLSLLPRAKVETDDSVATIPREAVVTDPSTSQQPSISSPKVSEKSLSSMDHHHEFLLQDKLKGKQEDYDLARILQEQTSHHLLCPNCGSCITRRVILKKRKRTQGGETTPEADQAKAIKLEDVDTVTLPREQQQSSSIETAVDGEQDESEAWGCLACFSIFFRKVREGLSQPLGDRADHFSCLPYLLPDFHWDGTGSFRLQQSDQEPASDRSFASCLPIEFPWTKETGVVEQPPEDSREIEILIDLTRPRQTIVLPDQESQLVSTESEPDKSRWSCLPFTQEDRQREVSEDEEASKGLSCLPLLTPKYWDKSIEKADNQEQQASAPEEQNQEEKGGLSCIPDLLPSLNWGSTTKLVAQVSVLPPSQEQKDLKEPTEDSDAKPAVEEPKIDLLVSIKKPVESEDLSKDETLEESTAPEPEPQDQVLDQRDVDTSVEEKKDTSVCECLPWRSQENENETKAGLNCLPLLIPAYSWGAATKGDLEQAKEPETKVATEEQVPDKKESPLTDKVPETYITEKDPAREETYITKETRIRAWIKSITNIVTIRGTTKDSTLQVNSVQADADSKFVDVTLSQKLDPAGKIDKTTTKDSLVSTPSTGWAVLDTVLLKGPPLDSQGSKGSTVTIQQEDEQSDQEEKLIDKRKPQQTEIQELDIPPEKPDKVGRVDELKQHLLPPDRIELDVPGLVASLSSAKDPSLFDPSAGPVTTTVSVKGPDALIQVKGDDPKQAVETALSIADLIPEASEEQETPQIQEYVKSIVYGGLDVTLTSLAVVSSGAGSGTKTINVLALSLANLIAGLITLFHNIGSLYQSDYTSFEQYIGQSLWINGSISIVSFLVFGCVAPVTYAFSFRSSGDKDYKFAATAAISLVCLFLLGLGRAHVQRKRYVTTIVNLVLTGFVASVAGYFVGDYVKRWLLKMGIDVDPSPTAPPVPPPPPPFPFLNSEVERNFWIS